VDNEVGDNPESTAPDHRIPQKKDPWAWLKTAPDPRDYPDGWAWLAAAGKKARESGLL
jgi:hypothetical protein